MEKIDFTRDEKLKIQRFKKEIFLYCISFSMMSIFFSFFFLLSGSFYFFKILLFINFILIVVLFFYSKNIVKFTKHLNSVLLCFSLVGGTIFANCFFDINERLLYFDFMYNFYLVLGSIPSFMFGYFYGRKYINNNHDYLIDSGKINYNLGRAKILFWKESPGKASKLERKILKMGTSGVYFLVMSLTAPIYIYFATKPTISSSQAKGIIASFLGYLLFYSFNGLIGMILYFKVHFKKWQKDHNRKIYTEFKDFLDEQGIINENRKKAGLKPLNIKKLFLGEKFYKG